MKEKEDDDRHAKPRSVGEEFVRRLGRQDPDGIQELFSPELDWYVPGSDALSWVGHRTRREDVAPYCATMWPRYVAGRSRVELKRIIADAAM